MAEAEQLELQATAEVQGSAELIRVNGQTWTYTDQDRVETSAQDDSFAGQILNVTVRVIPGEGPMKGAPREFSCEHRSEEPGKLTEAAVRFVRGDEETYSRTVPISRPK